MSKIKDLESAKMGLSGLFGSIETPKEERPMEKLQDKPVSKEELISGLDEETRVALKEAIARRQYLKVGRPPKGKKPQPSDEYVRMTFLIAPEKQERLRQVALKKGLFIREILERGIDLVLEEYDRKEGKR